ncbi:hypothetical protein [Nonomuraea sp. NPDC050691]|uniref:hypothetical protein n=1 Tax=Nonomuraea sp. NPDC050691 TaxID=3155661 RepID=UPI0033F005A8
MLGYGKGLPYVILARAVAEALDAPLRVRHLEARHLVVHAFSSPDKAKEISGVGADSVPLAEGLAQMAAWARKHGAQEPSVFSGIEVGRNMPPSWQALVR